MGNIDKIVELILIEAKANNSKLGLVSDIYRVSSDVDSELLNIMRVLREKERRNSK